MADNDTTTCKLNRSLEASVEIASAVADLQLTVNQLAFMIPLPFAVFGFVINALFIAAVTSGLKQRLLGKKLYAFLLCRAIADLLSTIVMISLGVGEFVEFLSLSTCVVLMMLCEFSYWTSAFANLSLTLLKLVAVKRPLWYRTTFTKRICTIVIVSFMMVALICALFHCILQKTVLNIRTHFKPLCHSAKGCHQLLLVWWISVTGGIYLCVLSCSLFTFYLLEKRQHESGTTLSVRAGGSSTNSAFSNGSRSANTAKYWKLGLNMLVYAIGNGLETPGGAINIYFSPLFYSGDFSQPCNYESIHEVAHARYAFYFVELTHVLFILRICCDPIANFVIDPNLRRALRSKLPKWLSRNSSNTDPSRSVVWL